MRPKSNEVELFKHFLTLSNYNRKKNIFTWRFGKYAGHRCGRMTDRGYWLIRFTYNGKTYYIYEHRVLYWALVPMQMPIGKCQIDHINGIRHDNRIENLRVVSARGNSCNSRVHRNGHLQHTSKVGNRWRSQASINGVHIHFGYFATQEEAHAKAIENLNKIGL